MTSTIEATLKKRVNFKQLLTALFPCGSVTGAPKIRTMQIIRELEKEPRGVYTGAIGYISPYKEACFRSFNFDTILNVQLQFLESLKVKYNLEWCN